MNNDRGLSPGSAGHKPRIDLHQWLRGQPVRRSAFTEGKEQDDAEARDWFACASSDSAAPEACLLSSLCPRAGYCLMACTTSTPIG